MYIDYINEAFKNLDLLTEDMFDASPSGINNLSRFMDEDDEIEEVRVIDADASDEDDIQDSYIGKVIINCNVCHSHVFEDKDEIVLADDGFANMDVSCPYCGQTEGFTIVGEIAEFKDKTEEISEKEEDSTEVEAPIEENFENENGTKAWSSSEISAFETAAKTLGLEKFDIASKGFGADEVAIISFVKAGKNFNKELPIENTHVDSANKAIELLKFEFDALNESTEVEEKESEKIEESLNESPRKFKPHTIRLLKLIGSDLITDDMSEAIKDPTSEDNKLAEDFKEVSITTDDQHMEMTSDESGKVSIVTEPVKPDVEGDTIVPVSDDTQTSIIANNQEDTAIETETDDMTIDFDSETVETEEPSSEEDVELEDIDETTIDELGESYLKRVYENVESFKTSNVYSDDNSLIIEGVIGFTSGSKKTTRFMFESVDMNENGQVRFIGTNKHLTESSNAYSLVGKVSDKKLIVESLKYNYKTADNNSVRGVVRKK